MARLALVEEELMKSQPMNEKEFMLTALRLFGKANIYHRHRALGRGNGNLIPVATTLRDAPVHVKYATRGACVRLLPYGEPPHHDIDDENKITNLDTSSGVDVEHLNGAVKTPNNAIDTVRAELNRIHRLLATREFLHALARLGFPQSRCTIK